MSDSTVPLSETLKIHSIWIFEIFLENFRENIKSQIEKKLNSSRFGAIYELAEIEDDYGVIGSHLLINAQHPVLNKYRRHFPDLENENHKKWSEYSKPTRNSSYNALRQ